MKAYVALLTDRTELEFQAQGAVAARYEAFRQARELGKVVFSVRPAGCVGLSPTSHSGAFCPIHPDA